MDRHQHAASPHLLRANVRVVSQEAFLISGSLRQNLTMGKEEQEEQEERGIAGGDGLSGAFDDVLWHCLRVVGLEEKVRSLPNALDFAVDVAGQNFSVGERQLITLARVLVPSRPCSLQIGHLHEYSCVTKQLPTLTFLLMRRLGTIV